MARTTFTVPTSKWATHVRLALIWLVARFITSGFSVGTYPGHHPDQKLAADFMVPGWQTAKGKALGAALARYLANEKVATRLGIWYVIWDGRIWSMTRPKAGWLPYFDRNSTNPSRSHKNHDHVSFRDRAPKDPLYVDSKPDPAPYTPGWRPPTPWVFYLDLQKIGVTKSTSVWLIQHALKSWQDKPKNGAYTQELRDAVKAWQRDELHDDPRYCDGILGRQQAKALFNDAVAIEDES